MTKTNSTIKRLISLICVATILMSTMAVFAIPASAASVTQRFDCDNTVSFTVRTGSKGTPSIKFVCDGARVSHHRCKAPLMAISISPSYKGTSFYLIKGTGTNISSTLKLAKNTTYTVKVSYYVHQNNCCNTSWGELVHDLGVGGLRSKYKGYNREDIYRNGQWYISRISNCTVANIRVR